jgi:hypothetical protein
MVAARGARQDHVSRGPRSLGELIANVGERSSRAAPNSWRLTPSGERVRASAGAG